MQLETRSLPVGINDFRTIRENGYYYIDKTGLIKELLVNSEKVTLFTRPHRFGSTLNMSMLSQFFSPDGDKGIFNGLEILSDTALCETYMGKYPALFLPLTDSHADSYREAYQWTVRQIVDTASRYAFLKDSKKLSDGEKAMYEALLKDDMEEETLRGSLKVLSHLLSLEYASPVVLLVDEYDTPLERASREWYDKSMGSLLGDLFGEAVQSDDIKLAVLTGCVPSAAQIILKGCSGVKVISITDTACDRFFGFTEGEVNDLLKCCQLENCREKAREWYRGFHFGSTEVYCPADVIRFCRDAQANPELSCVDYLDDFRDHMVLDYVRHLQGKSVRGELHTLLLGVPVRKKIGQDLPYDQLYEKRDALWSLLFLNGYLTASCAPQESIFTLSFPNREVRDTFFDLLEGPSCRKTPRNGNTREALYRSLYEGDAKGVEESVSELIERTNRISNPDDRCYFDETFYRGFLLGLLFFSSFWERVMPGEDDDGFYDIAALSRDQSVGILIELKCPHDKNLERAVRVTLDQIDQQGYALHTFKNRPATVRKYGFAFYANSCRVGLRM